MILILAALARFTGAEDKQAMFLRRSGVRTVLALLCGGVVVAALLSPWWQITIKAGGPGESLTVYPYRLRGQRLMELLLDSGTYSGPSGRTRQMTLHTLALASGAALCGVGAILKGRKRGVALAAAGILVLADVYAFLQRIAGICATNYSVPAQGRVTVIMPIGPYDITTRFQSGLYVAIAGGVLALLAAAVLGIVREK
jgi:hypothetical protein